MQFCRLILTDRQAALVPVSLGLTEKTSTIHTDSTRCGAASFATMSFSQRRRLGGMTWMARRPSLEASCHDQHLPSRCTRPAHSTFCVLFYVTLLSPTAQRLADCRHIRLGVELKLASPLAAILGPRPGILGSSNALLRKKSESGEATKVDAAFPPSRSCQEHLLCGWRKAG